MCVRKPFYIVPEGGSTRKVSIFYLFLFSRGACVSCGVEPTIGPLYDQLSKQLSFTAVAYIPYCFYAVTSAQRKCPKTFTMDFVSFVQIIVGPTEKKIQSVKRFVHKRKKPLGCRRQDSGHLGQIRALPSKTPQRGWFRMVLIQLLDFTINKEQLHTALSLKSRYPC